MVFWVYILRCADGSYYTGHTDNLDQRMNEHQAGAHPGYTANRLPVELAWSQECATREEALTAELQIKGWNRKKKEAMMHGDWDTLRAWLRKTSRETGSNDYLTCIWYACSLRYAATRLLRANGYQ